MLRNSGSILLAAAVWPLLQGCAGEHSPASFGTVSLPLSRTTADGEYRFLGTIRVLDESGAAAGSVECDEGSPPTQTVSLLPGTYETQVVAGYSCAYAGSLEGFTGCSFAAATPAPFAIERNATTTVLLTFVFHFEQAEDGARLQCGRNLREPRRRRPDLLPAL
jgi:hypothetical protein